MGLTGHIVEAMRKKAKCKTMWFFPLQGDIEGHAGLVKSDIHCNSKGMVIGESWPDESWTAITAPTTIH